MDRLSNSKANGAYLIIGCALVTIVSFLCTAWAADCDQRGGDIVQSDNGLPECRVQP